MGESLRVRRVRSGVPALPPRPAADGTRGRILLAGLGLFAEHGYHGTSIRDIAAEAAVQSASLYAHFPSKEQSSPNWSWPATRSTTPAW